MATLKNPGNKQVSQTKKQSALGKPQMQQQDMIGEQVPQQLMNPPAPLMSSSGMPTHPKNDQIMQEEHQNDGMVFNMNDDENDNIENLMDS